MSDVPVKYRTFMPRFAAGFADGLIFLPLGFAYEWVVGNSENRAAEQTIGYVFLGWFIAEFITMLSNPMRRAIHDYLADSVVVQTNEVGPSPFFT